MGKSSINGPFSMAMLNSQMVFLDIRSADFHRARDEPHAPPITQEQVYEALNIGWASRKDSCG